MIRDNIVYIKEFVSEFKATGTICPSSKWASRALAYPVRAVKSPKRILEIGAGTGCVTVYLLKYMTNADNLTICEINPRFMKELKRKLADNPDFIRNQERVDFFEGPIQDMPEDHTHDVLVCALPFLNFELRTVEEIFSKMLRLSNENTLMTYFEFVGLRRLGKVLHLGKDKARIKEIESYLAEQCIPRKVGQKTIWLNLLPINIYTLNMAA